MAHVLKDDFFLKVHQTLHGYVDGHRLIASSTVLKPRDVRTMLVMSDASGPRAAIDDVGYLTGYPLTDSGFYALARTWPAREIPRPGCVWTHTLLIDFADLALLTTMEFLLDDFRRPNGLAFGSYESEFTVPNFPGRTSGVSTSLGTLPERTLRHIIWALYSRPKDRIVASADTYSSKLVLLLWGQQWPRLRRAFRFCTLSFADRSGDAGAFDLQFLPARERAIRSRFSDLTDADRLQPEPVEWLDDVLSDLNKGRSGNLRTFLREVGSDVSGGREVFVKICRLYQLVKDFADRPPAIDEAVSLIEDWFELESASSLRSVITAAAASHPELLGERAVAFLANHLELLKIDDIVRIGPRLAKALWDRDPKEFQALYSRQPPWPDVAELAVASLSIDDLLRGLHRHPDLVPSLILRRPDLLTQPSFWMIPGSSKSSWNVLEASDANQLDAAVGAMVLANRSDLATEVVRNFGCGQILRAIGSLSGEYISETSSENLSTWLAAAATDKNALATALSRRVIKIRTLLVMVAHRTEPNFIPNEYGADPWWTALRNSQGDLSDQDLQYLSAYLLARGLGVHTRNPAELISSTLDYVYPAAYQSKLSSEALRLLSDVLPSSYYWPDWDVCHRLLAGIVDVFLRRKLSPAVFAQLTKDDQLFSDLVLEVTWMGRIGRRYLKRVRTELKKLRADNSAARIKIIADIG